jgi:hypothetical protein
VRTTGRCGLRTAWSAAPVASVDPLAPDAPTSAAIIESATAKANAMPPAAALPLPAGVRRRDDECLMTMTVSPVGEVQASPGSGATSVSGSCPAVEPLW